MLERLVLPKKSTPPLRTRQRRKIDFITTKQANRLKSRLTMTLTNGRLRQAINNQRAIGTTSDNEKQDYVSVIIVVALQDEQSTPKVCMVTGQD